MIFASNAFASNSYITGNVKFNSDIDARLGSESGSMVEAGYGSDVVATIEAGHAFDNSFGDLTVYIELDGLQLGTVDYIDTPYTMLGIEQSFSTGENFWVAAGYQNVIHQGDSIESRMLVRLGYDFDSGVSLSHRTRIDLDSSDYKRFRTRFDNSIAYSPTNFNAAFSYNNIYYLMDEGTNSIKHEVRATWTRNGVQPYLEFGYQDDLVSTHGFAVDNYTTVIGASYAF